jgi:hypothetical protein
MEMIQGIVAYSTTPVQSARLFALAQTSPAAPPNETPLSRKESLTVGWTMAQVVLTWPALEKLWVVVVNAFHLLFIAFSALAWKYRCI